MVVMTSLDDQVAERGGIRVGGVVVFSATNAQYADLSGSHRDHSGSLRQDFCIQNPEAGVTYHATFAHEAAGGYQPRHRHGMEQVRLMVAGEMTYLKKTYGAGWLGFFPEGVFYGPHEWTKPGTWIVSQEQGPSNGPFHSKDDMKYARNKIREAGGAFVDGLCVWPSGKKQDSHEACMEMLYGGEIEFPPALFAAPVWVDTEKFEWKTSRFAGTLVKRLGVFGEHGPAVELIKMEPGATIPAGITDRIVVRWIYDGEAKYGDISCPGDPTGKVSNISYSPGAQYDTLTSDHGATIMSLELKIPEGSLPYLV